MKNKIFKIIIVLGLLFFIIIGGILTFIIYALPSTKTIGQAVGGSFGHTSALCRSGARAPAGGDVEPLHGL